MSCDFSAGYQGYLLVCSHVLPFLTADIVKVTEILPSAGIHGGGVSSTNPIFRSPQNFALGRIIAEGSVSTEIYAGTGNYATAWLDMLKRSIPSISDDTNVCTGFDSSCKLIFSPGGGSEIVMPSTSAGTPRALIASMELRGNNGGVAQSTFRIISSGADYNTTNANKPSVSALQFETAGSTDDSNPVPYWATNFSVTGSGETGTLADQIMDWNISVNNNVTPIFTFNGEQFAQSAVLGMMQVTGSFQYYSPTGQFVENLTNGAVITITVGSTTITIPFVGFGRCPVPSPGINSPTVRNCEFLGFSTASGPAIFYA